MIPIISILTFIATVILGPCMFYILSRILTWPGNYLKKNTKTKNNVKTYPTGITDSIGDLIFLPLFNAILISIWINDKQPINQISIIKFITTLIFAFIITFLYYYFDLKQDYIDWSKPEKNKYNAGGYYHLSFMFIQLILVIYGIINYYSNILLWLALIGYATTFIVQLVVYKHW